jgi:tetratricopeptide (TPR) repeat protein
LTRRYRTIARIIILAAASFAAGCTAIVYTPSPHGAAGMTISEARRTLGETLREAKPRDGKAYIGTRTADDGFSLTGLWNGESRTREYRFRELPDLTVKRSGKLSFVELGREPEAQVAWDATETARRFVDAALALKYLQSAQPLATDNEAFAAFREKAAEWREMRPKPPFPEGAVRYRMLAEEAARNNDFDGAASFYEQALAIHPLWPEGQLAVADLYGNAGMFAKAVAHMKRYLELLPNGPEAPFARTRMQGWEAGIGKAR